jgi:hypothetical protein
MKLDKDGFSAMTRKFVLCDTQEPTPQPTYKPEVIKAMMPRVYFVYGSLMDPATLQAVIAAREPPMLRPAMIFGYHIKMWESIRLCWTADLCSQYMAWLSRLMILSTSMRFGNA